MKKKVTAISGWFFKDQQGRFGVARETKKGYTFTGKALLYYLDMKPVLVSNTDDLEIISEGRVPNSVFRTLGHLVNNEKVSE